jgi:hypothetical protein
VKLGINGYFLAFGYELGTNWVKLGEIGYLSYARHQEHHYHPEILKLIADIDEFKGSWKVIETLAPERLTSLRRIATIESVGSSTRIEGSKLSDAEVEKLLSGMETKSFAGRDTGACEKAQ